MRKLVLVVLALSLAAACNGSDTAETPATAVSSTVPPAETDAVEATIAPVTTQAPTITTRTTTTSTVTTTPTVTAATPATTVPVSDVVAETLERLAALTVADPESISFAPIARST